MKYLAILTLFLMTGCVGYQNVRTYETIDGERVLTNQVKAIIIGTSGQKIATKNVTIEKKDTSDKVADMFEKGVTAALTVTKGVSI